MTKSTPFPSASATDAVRFTALVGLPNVAQGLFRPRPRVAAAINQLGVPSRAHQFLAALQRRYGDGPLWVRVAGRDTLLVFGPEPIRFVLSNAPDPFASDPEPKRSGMLKFQPHALTISRGAEWSDRRQFTDAVMAHAHSTSAIRQRFSRIAAEEAPQSPAQIDWRQFNAIMRRVARRIILGDTAIDDQLVSKQLAALMDKANPPTKGNPKLCRMFTQRLAKYVTDGEYGSLVGLFHTAPTTAVTDPTGQIIHWMFAMGDTLAINIWRCLGLLATHPAIRQEAHHRLDEVADTTYLSACLYEAMRLWPTTGILARTTTRNTDWNGVDVQAGTPVLIVNTFNHRDTARFPWADRFQPNMWLDGSGGENWSFNFFSNGPQVCPGAQLAVQLGTALMAAVLRDSFPIAHRAALDPSTPLPNFFNHTRLRITLKPRGHSQPLPNR
ncbi:MAG: cytochrome P450 [Mycobacterium sp.]